LPFFIGVITNGTNSYFAASRLPIKSSGTTATALCQKGDNDCDDQNDVIIMAQGLTLASWTSRPITQVGWIPATFVNSGSEWTLSTTLFSGFNTNYEKQTFLFPTGQSGAATGTHMLANGGTAPVFTTSTYAYTIDPSGVFTAYFELSGDGGTDGSGAVNARLSTPYRFPNSTIQNIQQNNGYTDSATTLTTGQVLASLIGANTTYLQLRYLNSTAVLTSITNAMYSAGARTLRGTATFNVFGNY
jgi:hypothetical protein